MSVTNKSKKQKAYRLKRFQKGQCQRCLNKRMPRRVLCEACTIDRRIHQRKYINASPWTKGSRGRPIQYFNPDGSYS